MTDVVDLALARHYTVYLLDRLHAPWRQNQNTNVATRVLGATVLFSQSHSETESFAEKTALNQAGEIPPGRNSSHWTISIEGRYKTGSWLYMATDTHSQQLVCCSSCSPSYLLAGHVGGKCPKRRRENQLSSQAWREEESYFIRNDWTTARKLSGRWWLINPLSIISHARLLPWWHSDVIWINIHRSHARL